jgi:uncharacterized membrane protein YcaP (DUF421 family)
VLIVFFRTLVLYTIALVVMRLMGKRQIGQLQPFEFVVTIIIADLVAVPMQDKDIALINGIIPVATLLVAQLSLSYVTLKSSKAREIICGKPSILVKNGVVVGDELNRLLYNLNDLMEQLRVKGYPNIQDVEFAVLETNGDLSVTPVSQKRPIIPEDLCLATNYEGLPLLLIVDGQIQPGGLKKAHLSEDQLCDKLNQVELRPKDILVATLDSKGRFFYQKK